MAVQTISIILTILVATPIVAFDLGLIRSFFQYNSLKFGTIIACSNDRKENFVAVTKGLMSNGISVNVLYFEFNITRDFFDNTNKHFGIVIKRGENFDQILKWCADVKLFTERHRWLIMDESMESLDTFRKLPILVDSEIYLAIFNNTLEQKWKIYDIYNPSLVHGGNLFVKLIGSYEDDKFIVVNYDSKYWRRRNFTGITFHSVIVLPRPFSGTIEDYAYDDTKRSVNTLSRFNYCLIKHLQEFYGFGLKIRVTNSWGYIQPNGSFDGMIGALERKEIDFGTTTAFYNLRRARVVDYARVTWLVRSSFVFRHPKTYPTNIYSVFLKPLDTSVWICTFIALLLLIIFLKLSSIYEWKFLRHLNIFCDRTWSYCTLFMLGILCQQGPANSPNLHSGRVITMSALFLSIFILQFYSASIVSTLLMDTPITIRTFRDLLLSSLKVGVEDVLFNKAYFDETTDPAVLELYSKKILKGKHSANSSPGFYVPDEGLNLLKKGGFAFLVENPTAYKEIQDSFPNDAICELAEIPVFRGRPMIPVLQKWSPFREMLNYGLQRLAENGVLHRQRLHWNPNKPECIEKGVRDNIDLIEFSPILELLCLGMVLSFVIFCTEFILHKYLIWKYFRETTVFPYVN